MGYVSASKDEAIQHCHCLRVPSTFCRRKSNMDLFRQWVGQSSSVKVRNNSQTDTIARHSKTFRVYSRRRVRSEKLIEISLNQQLIWTIDNSYTLPLQSSFTHRFFFKYLVPDPFNQYSNRLSPTSSYFFQFLISSFRVPFNQTRKHWRKTRETWG